MTTFSVISVTLNDLAGLQRTYRSLRAQRHGDYTWVVLDGGSDDGTVDWLTRLDPARVSWVSERDAGLYDAMNKGIERAQGDYLVFLNGGDEFADADVLARVGSAATDDPVPDFLFGDAIDVTAEGHELYRRARSHRSLWWTMFTAHQAMFFRRARIGDLRYRLEYRYAADYAFVAEFLDPARGGVPVVRRVTGPLCRFWLGGASWTQRPKAIREDFTIRRRHLRLSRWLSAALFLAHHVHLRIKRGMPSVARRLRYRRTDHAE